VIAAASARQYGKPVNTIIIVDSVFCEQQQQRRLWRRQQQHVASN
jgi:hypothetical protein